MADFVAVLKKTIDGMGETTPQMRARVYDKARSTIAAKLAAINPPPPEAVAERQKRTLEDAIAAVEKEYARPAPAPLAASDPLAELESIFSSIDRNKNQPSHVRPSPRVEPPRQEPAEVPVTAAAPRNAPDIAAAAPGVGAAAPKTPAAERPPQAPAIERPSPKPDVGREESPAYPSAGPETELFRETGASDRPRRRGGLVAALVALVAIAGGAYGVWANADAFRSMFGGGGQGVETVQVEPLAPAAPQAPAEPAAPSPTVPASDAANTPTPDAAETPKFTQRLTPEGKEVDPGPAGGESTIGEGTSVVALTTPPPDSPPSTPDDPAATEPAAAQDGTAAGTPPVSEDAPAEAGQPALAVGQKAIFYEERTNVAQGSAEPGNIVWSLVQESPGGDTPPEPAIRAEANIPGKNVQLRMTIRRNTDETLPASHIIELIFLTPEGFEGGSIDNILRIAMKASEQDAGSPLVGIPAKIADGFFLVALNDTKADEQTNLTLLRNQDWIDIPVVYKSGRRALITMEKGIPGDKVFDEALKAWQEKSAG